MPNEHFPGYPAFLEAAAQSLGRPELAAKASRNPTLAAMANLCAQAVKAEAAHVEGILVRAREFLDHLSVAHEAAKLMLRSMPSGLDSPRSKPPRDARGKSGSERSGRNGDLQS